MPASSRAAARPRRTPGGGSSALMLEGIPRRGRRPAASTPPAPGPAGHARDSTTHRRTREPTDDPPRSRPHPSCRSDERPPTATSPASATSDPAEIARRRRAGHVGLAATLVLLTGLVAIGAPPPVRFLVALPAAAGGIRVPPGSFQVLCRLRFEGIYNFGELGRPCRWTRPRPGVATVHARTRSALRAPRSAWPSGSSAVGAAAVTVDARRHPGPADVADAAR